MKKDAQIERMRIKTRRCGNLATYGIICCSV